MTILNPTNPILDGLGHFIHGHGAEKVLALHDWMGDAANFEPLLPYLDLRRYTYAFADLRGYGSSLGPTPSSRLPPMPSGSPTASAGIAFTCSATR
jgi:pimeloyl-ACP methyl ester carboxylesterase